jgi:hypothetical protein
MSLRDLNGFPDSEHGTETDGNVLFRPVLHIRYIISSDLK